MPEVLRRQQAARLLRPWLCARRRHVSESPVDWKLLAVTFGSVFLAELGDKTQLATLTFAAGSTSRWSVFLGSAAALVLSSAVAVIGGEAVTRVLPPVWLKRIAGGMFLLIGTWVLWTTRTAN